MNDPAKHRRPYRSEKRAAKARETRERMLDGAAGLFAEKGYAGTALRDVAERAGVAPETIYTTFGSKRALLLELITRAVLGTEQQKELTEVLEQEGPQRIRREPDARKRLRLFSNDVVLRIERVERLLEAASGARGDPGVQELVGRLHRARYDNLRTLVEGLEQDSLLRAGLDLDEATQTVWALASPELHLLVTERGGWSRHRYVAWLAATLDELLLPRE